MKTQYEVTLVVHFKNIYTTNIIKRKRWMLTQASQKEA